MTSRALGARERPWGEASLEKTMAECSMAITHKTLTITHGVWDVSVTFLREPRSGIEFAMRVTAVFLILNSGYEFNNIQLFHL